MAGAQRCESKNKRKCFPAMPKHTVQVLGQLTMSQLFTNGLALEQGMKYDPHQFAVNMVKIQMNGKRDSVELWHPPNNSPLSFHFTAS